MNKTIQILSAIRAPIVRWLRPNSDYFLGTRSLQPLSRKFGFDRGTPIDRYWIESFLNKYKLSISGKSLEVGDSRYTKQFGSDRVSGYDVLDIDTKNTSATIRGDLRNLRKQIRTNTYDTIILTHVLGIIDDFDAAIAECHRILKPGGTLLATVSCFSPTHNIEANYWRFTTMSAEFAFGKHFPKMHTVIESYGNVLTGQCFWVGMAQEELEKKELAYNDPAYPCIIGIKTVKKITQHE